MEITFAPRGILQIDDARIVYRNFALIIPDRQLADDLIANGWNVRIKPPREEGDDPFMYLPVKVRFNDRGPNVYLKSGSNLVKLDEESISCLDEIDILDVDLDIRPYDWEVNGKTGRTAYLQSIRVTQDLDRFAAEEEEY